MCGRARLAIRSRAIYARNNPAVVMDTSGNSVSLMTELVGLPGLPVSVSEGTVSQEGLTLTCKGPARIIVSAPTPIVGTTNAWGGKVEAGGAAVFADQWGGKDHLTPFRHDVSGSVEGGSFTGITDTIGGKGSENLQSRYPTDLIIEFVSAPQDLGEREITLTVPKDLGCPLFTKPAGK